jgi:hypothetical protein
MSVRFEDYEVINGKYTADNIYISGGAIDIHIENKFTHAIVGTYTLVEEWDEDVDPAVLVDPGFYKVEDINDLSERVSYLVKFNGVEGVKDA